MSDISEHLERLINRSLDGALAEEEQLQLDRELIRNPAARRLFDEYAATDKAALCALDRALGGAVAAPALSATPSGRGRALVHPRFWWFVPGAIAASLLAMVVPYPTGTRTQQAVSPPAITALPNGISQPWDGQTHNVLHSGRQLPRYQRDKGTEVIGVVGDDGNVYWLEVERTRTIKLPPEVGAPRFDVGNKPARRTASLA